jgi:molybdate transport system substrate-binding protein
MLLLRALAFVLVSASAMSCLAPARETVVVFAAASLSEPFRTLERGYETAHPGVDVVLNLAGSQLLASQLREGARADVFASADAETLERVLLDRPEARASRRVFAANRVIAIVAADSQLRTLDQLGTPGLRIVLAGPEVPIGRYARAALDQLGLRAAVEANLVSNEDSVNGVLAKVALGEADAGIVYATDLGRAAKLRAIPMPPKVQVRARYELAVLPDGPNREHGLSFAAYVLGLDGQAVLRDHGLALDQTN